MKRLYSLLPMVSLLLTSCSTTLEDNGTPPTAGFSVYAPNVADFAPGFRSFETEDSVRSPFKVPIGTEILVMGTVKDKGGVKSARLTVEKQLGPISIRSQNPLFLEGKETAPVDALLPNIKFRMGSNSCIRFGVWGEDFFNRSDQLSSLIIHSHDYDGAADCESLQDPVGPTITFDGEVIKVGNFQKVNISQP